MKNKLLYYIMVLLLGAVYSCSPREISTKYYEEHSATLDSIEESYMKLYKQKPFRLAFTNKDFESISLDIITDTLTYIYEFTYNEKRFTDTLVKFNMDAGAIKEMVRKMHTIRCTWINNFDYYLEGEKKSLVFLSIKPAGLSGPFSGKRYYIITYFSQKQYYDAKGRLLSHRRQRQLLKVNGEVFKRINDKVSYTVSNTYR